MSCWEWGFLHLVSKALQNMLSHTTVGLAAEVKLLRRLSSRTGKKPVSLSRRVLPAEQGF